MLAQSVSRLLAVLLVSAVVLSLPSCGDDKGNGSENSGSQQASGAGEATSRPQRSGDWKKDGRQALASGVDFLMGQRREGRWDGRPGTHDLGISALAARAALAKEGDEVRSQLKPVLDWIAGSQKEDGSIFDKQLAVYVTSASMLALAKSGDASYMNVLKRAANFMTLVQSDEGDGIEESGEDYGGVGYGGSGVVNMSTTQLAIEAADKAGLSKDSEFYSKALKYLERSQNRSESNDRGVREIDGVKIGPGNDGGGIYRPSGSKAGVVKPAQGPAHFRSYGSMTYALLKSYLLCNLDANDARVKAAVKWIANNWELEWNPGMEALDKPEARYQGLYYYYFTLARCLEVAEGSKIDMSDPELATWRERLVTAILKRQKADGSWANVQGRWMESNPVLATTYAVMALEAALN